METLWCNGRSVLVSLKCAVTVPDGAGLPRLSEAKVWGSPAARSALARGRTSGGTPQTPSSHTLAN